MKKNCLTLLLFVLFSGISFAQSELAAIQATLMDYIEGTAKGQPDRLRQAFQPDFQLFVIDQDTLRVIDGKGYIDRVEPGKTYNRLGKIISIDYENDAAAAKVEVYFPDRQKVATDYLLLLKIQGKWTIIHKLINLKNADLAEHPVPTDEFHLQEINQTLQHYIKGTANSDLSRLHLAFQPNFNLYYVKNDSLSILTGAKYLDYFKAGKKNNRIGKVLQIDYEKDAALAKVEVKMPDRDRIAIDYLLLLKIDGTWKIIHKSFTSKSWGK